MAEGLRRRRRSGGLRFRGADGAARARGPADRTGALSPQPARRVPEPRRRTVAQIGGPRNGSRCASRYARAQRLGRLGGRSATARRPARAGTDRRPGRFRSCSRRGRAFVRRQGRPARMRRRPAAKRWTVAARPRRRRAEGDARGRLSGRSRRTRRCVGPGPRPNGSADARGLRLLAGSAPAVDAAHRGRRGRLVLGRAVTQRNLQFARFRRSEDVPGRARLACAAVPRPARWNPCPGRLPRRGAHRADAGDRGDLLSCARLRRQQTPYASATQRWRSIRSHRAAFRKPYKARSPAPSSPTPCFEGPLPPILR